MSTSTPNFASILAESPTEVIRPKPLPVGTYLCTVGQYELGKSSKKQTPFFKFPLKPLAPLADVNEAALDAAGGLEGKSLSITFYLTPDAIFMLDDFHVNCGVDLDDGLDRRQRSEDVTNAQVLAVVEHEVNNDNPNDERIFVRVNKTARAD